MKGNEKRLGSQQAPIADMVIGDKKLTVSSIHLDAHSTQKHRAHQLSLVVKKIAESPAQPSLIAGDWNTCTYNSSKAVHAIIGFWIRVGMGIDNMIRNHYPHPDRYWEKELFQMLENNGYDYKSCNELGAGTLVYDFNDEQQFKNLRDWIPQWCFHFIEWALRNHNGRVSFKLDWFAKKDLESFNPKVINKLRYEGKAVSDHEAISLDFKL